MTTTPPPSPPPPPPDAAPAANGMAGWAKGLIVCGAIFAVLVIIGALFGETDEDAGDQPAATTTTAAQPAATRPPATVPADCQPATDGDLAQILPLLHGDVTGLGQAYATNGPDGRRYIGVTLYTADDERMSWGDAFALGEGNVYAITMSAKLYSMGVPADDAIGVTVADPDPEEVIGCNDAAVRAGDKGASHWAAP